MSDLLPQLILSALGGAIAPPLLLLTILFLGSQEPLSNATALGMGYLVTCAVMGIVGLTLFDGPEREALPLPLTVSSARRLAPCSLFWASEASSTHPTSMRNRPDGVDKLYGTGQGVRAWNDALPGPDQEPRDLHRVR